MILSEVLWLVTCASSLLVPASVLHLQEPCSPWWTLPPKLQSSIHTLNPQHNFLSLGTPPRLRREAHGSPGREPGPFRQRILSPGISSTGGTGRTPWPDDASLPGKGCDQSKAPLKPRAPDSSSPGLGSKWYRSGSEESRHLI